MAKVSKSEIRLGCALKIRDLVSRRVERMQNAHPGTFSMDDQDEALIELFKAQLEVDLLKADCDGQ